jgi:hypothetical protein
VVVSRKLRFGKCMVFFATSLTQTEPVPDVYRAAASEVG